MKGNREQSILFYSNQLFIQNGYKTTTMRQIAERAGVSLGLSTYYYKTKRQIAVTVLDRYLRLLKARLRAKSPTPLDHSAAMVRLCIEYLWTGALRQFYLECLELDIYGESLRALGNEAMRSITQAYHVNMSEDMQLLFDNYIPPSVERILVLEKEKGNFPGISREEIPNIVFAVSVEKNIGKAEIERACERGKVLAREVFAALPKDLTETLFLNE